ncbi:hypothetical protein E5D57_002265 [Metarhizium anisopliae]|nr:hypothetical protein E5D57_012837 [Metarhizium anisopliae]KAF5125320.1 hypothetical protein E5D57_010007 [Metarhizium anisopliae]KAF5127524.1 hypothetical protein E5D57_008457 [Metarhizium anisopliae]KAF5131509.1 hypothetical protein E5D57_007864 [Metarhizium anisopliae]KAF5138479.1 hypothetical protein E5D57_002265 [Metarhizium anisopliae]
MQEPTSPLSSLGSTSSPPPISIESSPKPFSSQLNANARKKRRESAEKLDLVWRYIRDDLNWSIGDFVRALATSGGQTNAQRRTAFAKATFQDATVLDSFVGRSGNKNIASSRGHLIQYLNIGAIELRQEIEQLSRLKPFLDTKGDEMVGFERLSSNQIIGAAEDKCPLLIQTLRSILTPENHVRRCYKGMEDSGYLINILAVLCRSQQRNRSSGFQIQLSIYLHSKGVKRRQLEALQRLGLCSSYHKTLQVIKKQSEQAAKAVAARGQQPTVITAYDNFEQMEHVKEQRVDNQSSFHSVTTGQLIQGIEMPEGGLLQSMLNPTTKLQLEDIFLSPGNQRDAIEVEISRHFVYESIGAAFPDCMSMASPPRMPVIDILPRRRTAHLSLGPIPYDESTNAGNLNVLRNIFQEQYQLPDEAFNDRLLLIYGDQKTIQRIRTIKSRRSRAARPVDSLQWALPVPALFHLRMNYLYMLSRTHFGAAGDGSKATLYDTMNFWIRKGIQAKKADFYALEQLIIHSFQARICALMWSRLRDLGLGDTEMEISRILQSYGPNELNGLIESIMQSYDVECRYTRNPELRNHILFLQHTQNYLVLKHAIKHADLGLLHRAITRSCVYFHASGQHKYAFEMLYLKRLISTTAAAPELQRAILANGLVNTTGADDGWLEIDRLVEFHNGTLKTILRDRRGSAITVKYLMENCALNTEFFKSVAENIESLLGMNHNANHPEKKAIKDIRMMAGVLVESGSITGTQRRPVTHEAIDLFDAAISKLAAGSLCKFNRRACLDPLDLTADDFNVEEEDAVDEIDEFFAIDAEHGS